MNISLLPDKLLRCGAVTAVLAAALVSGSASAAITQSYFADNSALSSGRWVKVTVNHTGVQKITAEQLREWGFSDPSKVAVCGYGLSQVYSQQISDNTPDDLKAVASQYTDGALLFYGEGPLVTSAYRVNTTGALKPRIWRNYYSDFSCYYLTDAIDPVQPATVQAPDVSATASGIYTSASVMHLEQENVMPEIGAPWLMTDLSVNKTPEFEFTLPGYRQSPQSEWQNKSGYKAMNITVCYGSGQTAGGTGTWTLPSTSVKHNYFSTNQAEVLYKDYTFSALDNPEENATCTFTVKGDFSANTRMFYGGIDYVNVVYRRYNTLAAGGQQRLLFMSLSSSDCITLSDLPEGAAVWDVTSPLKPRVLTLSAADDQGRRAVAPGVSVNANGTVATPTLAVFTSADLYTPEYYGEVAPQNLHAMATPEMVILAGESYVPYAEKIASLHRTLQGMDVAVVTPVDIYNEFSSGIPTPLGIRRFLKMLDTRTPGRLRSLLIMADASSDSRNLQGLGKNWPGDYVPLLQCQHFYISGWLGKSYATDYTYGVLDEKYNIYDKYNLAYDMTLNVGRLPVTSESDAIRAVAKIEKYFNKCNANSRAAALVSADRGEKNSFAEQADTTAQIIGRLSPHTAVTKMYAEFYPDAKLTDILKDALAQDAAFWTYTGHASPGGLTGAQYNISETSIPVANPPLAYWGTCRAAYIDHGGSSVGRESLLSTAGGVSGLIASTREVYKDPNQTLAEAATRGFYTAQAGDRMGDVFRRARNEVSASVRNDHVDTALVINSASYNFFGDPELPLRLPARTAMFTSVDGKSSGKVTVEPLKTFRVEGRIADGETTDAAFNGELTITVYDAPFQATNEVEEDGTVSSYTTTFDNDRVFTIVVPVTDGLFSADLMMPAVARPGIGNRVSLSAVSSDRSAFANGSYSDLIVAELPSGIDDTQYSTPEISRLWLDRDDFRPGDVTNGSPMVYAVIEPDPDCLSISSRLPGQSLVVTLDGSKSYTDAAGSVTQYPDGSARLAYPMSGLTDGPHTIEVKVRNMAGNSASKSIHFTVVNTPIDGRLEVSENPVTDKAEFTLTHDLQEEPQATLMIFDSAGRTVFSEVNATFPYTWNLTGNDGKRVAMGRYKVRAKLSSGNSYGATSETEVVVIR